MCNTTSLSGSDDPLAELENVLLRPRVAGGARTNLTGDVEEVVLKLDAV